MSCLIKLRCRSTRSLLGNFLGRRMISENCGAEEPENKCTTPSFRDNPCFKKSTQSEPQLTTPPLVSMWENPECYAVCDTLEFRHDPKYLKYTHWTDRKYKRTWYQCTPISKPKICPPQIKYPEPELRPRGVGNPDAKWCATVSPCAQVEAYNKPCEQCRPRKSCKGKKSTCCQKRCTLYPSFSECCRPRPDPPRPIECNCLTPKGLCALNEYLNSQENMKTTSSH